MTTFELIENYRLHFFNAIEDLENTPKVIDKRLDTFCDALTVFLYAWHQPHSIDTEILSDLTNVINGVQESFDINHVYTLIVSTTELTEIYDENVTSGPVAIIPTQDFYDILVLWRDFLLEPPLNGTKVEEPKTGKHKNWLGKVRSFFKRRKDPIKL